jgi:hypothetical protein
VDLIDRHRWTGTTRIDRHRRDRIDADRSPPAGPDRSPPVDRIDRHRWTGSIATGGPERRGSIATSCSRWTE